MVAINSFPLALIRPQATHRSDRARATQEATLYDKTLVLRFNAGDGAAFFEIVTKYREKMFHIAFGYLHNRGDAEEVAQDTFVRAHRSLGRFRGDSSLATWLHRIATNLARNRYWHFFRRRRHLTQSLDGVFADDNRSTLAEILPCEAQGPEREVMSREFLAVVEKCMTHLKPHERDVLVRRSLLNSTYEEISAAIGINVGTVKSRLARARMNLRELVGEACPEFASQASSIAFFEPDRSSDRWATCA